MDKNINNPKNEFDKVLGINRTLFLVIVVLLCVLALCVGIYAQFFYRYSESDPLMLGINSSEKEEEEVSKLISNFDNLFNENGLVTGAEYDESSIVKEDSSQSIVYTTSTVEEESENNYSITAYIPYINIDSDLAKEINEDIEENFVDEISRVKGTTDKGILYTVNYIAYTYTNMLSIAVRSTYYEKDGTQTTEIKTYNYNLEANITFSLSDVLNAKGLTLSVIQNEIKDEIQKLNDDEAQVGYSSTERDVDSDMYLIENTDTFLVSSEGDVYIIYNYGTKKDVLLK